MGSHILPLLSKVDPSWTLFLDRDGVINHEKNNDYIRRVSEFIFYNGVLDSLKLLSQKFGVIVIVTNQRGVGRGLMTHEDLHHIHENMVEKINSSGGRIDKIYYAPELEDDSINRKPNTGMGLKAKLDFPQIDFAKSIMIGNNVSDMQFGKQLGMHTIYLETTKALDAENVFTDYKIENLLSFAQLYKSIE